MDMPTNIINFLNSKDNLYDDFSMKKKIQMLFFLLVFSVLEIVLFIFKVDFMGKTMTVLDVALAILFAVGGVVNLIVSCFFDRVQIHYIYYGVIFLLLSVYLFYIGTRLALFPFSEYCGLIGIGVWLLLSAVFILGIYSNIKHDRYADTYKVIFWMDDKKTGTKGVVLSKYTAISIVIILLFEGILAFLYIAFPDLFTSGTETFSRIWQLGLVYCAMTLSFFALFSWKLILKQYYVHKYDISIKIKG